MNMLTLAAQLGLTITKRYVPNYTGNVVEYVVWGSDPYKPLFRTVKHEDLMEWLTDQVDIHREWMAEWDERFSHDS